MPEQSPRLSGRRAQAARNDQLILAAARAVFLADPDAPISAVAERAGVGIAALYRRFRSKDDLLQHLALEGLRRYNEIAQAALDDEGDPWAAFSGYMERALGAGGGSLSRKLSGTFTVSPELRDAGVLAMTLTQQIVDRAKAAGVLRPGVEPSDISLLSESIQGISLGDDERDAQLRQRYLRVVLDGLLRRDDTPLPSTAPDLAEMAARFAR